jgi:AraC-like DNA-binding protein
MLSIVYIVGGVQGLFFIFMILNERNRQLADILLSAFLFLVSLSLIKSYFDSLGVFDQYPSLRFISIAIPLLYGPLLYMYTENILLKQQVFKKTYFLHFLPAIIFNLIIIDLYFLDKDELIKLFQTRAIDSTWRLQFASILQLVVSPIYIGFALSMLNRHEKQNLNIFSEPEKINLSWLKILLWSFGLIWIVITVNVLIYEFSQAKILVWAHYTFTILFVFFVFFIGYMGIKKSNIFADVKFFEGQKDEKSLISKKELVVDTDDSQIQKLIQYMDNEKPYLRSNLTISELANELNIQPHILSSILNNKLSKNFFDFVNQYRIEDFKNRIHDPENLKYTILALAYECGFNSKSSFNRIFKNYEGITPSEYLKSIT